MKLKQWNFSLKKSDDNTVILTYQVITSVNATKKQAFGKAWFKFHGKKNYAIGFKIVLNSTQIFYQ